MLLHLDLHRCLTDMLVCVCMCLCLHRYVCVHAHYLQCAVWTVHTTQRGVRSTLVRLQLFLIHNIKAYSTWNSNYNMHSDERTKSIRKCDIRHEPKCFVVDNYTDSFGALHSDWGKKCLFSLVNCTLCDSYSFAGGDSL